MRLGVTGADGFIGNHLVNKLGKEKIDFVKITRSNGYDISNIDSLKSLKDIDVFIHLAGKSSISDSYQDPGLFFDTNVNGTNHILSHALTLGAKVVFISSYVYGNPRELPTPETSNLIALNPYAASKIMGEDLCDYYSTFFGLKTLVLRPFNVYGPDQSSVFLIPKIIEQAKNGSINLYSPKPKRDYINVSDIIDAIILSTQVDVPLEQNKINLGSGTSISNRELAIKIASYYDRPIDIIYTDEDKPIAINETCADITRAHKLLSWAPKISLDQGLSELILS